jgi:hypothetical protein
MPKEIIKKTKIQLIDGTVVKVEPLKLAYLKEVMERFDDLKTSQSEDESMEIILDCVAISMQQFYPELNTTEKVADSIDMKTLYVILEYGANISMDPSKSKPIEEQAQEELKKKKDSQENESWEEFDLMKYELQVFLLGIWKNLDELERSLSLPELTEILSTHNENEYNNRKFSAAIQGVDLEGGKEEEDPWEAMKARVAEKTSGISVANSNDITSFQGVKARQAGFGIGMGLDYERID